MSETAYPALTRAFAELLSVALKAAPVHGGGARTVLRSLEAAEAHIAQVLCDPDLNADGVARALGLSRASLYRLFQPRGGIARHIARKRLELIRRRLEAGDGTPFEAMAEAAGFRSARAARQSFQDLEGVEPEAYRRPPATEGVAAETERDRLRWAAWMGDL